MVGASTCTKHGLEKAASTGLPNHCVPCQQDGPAVAAIRRRMQMEAAALGCTATDDADLHMLADGICLEPHWMEPLIATFRLPHAARDVRLASRSMRPQDLHDTPDTRLLGVAIRRIWAAGRRIGLGKLEGQTGWWPLENGDAPFRWTDGSATLPPGARSFRVEVLMRLHYIVPPTTQATAVSAAMA